MRNESKIIKLKGGWCLKVSCFKRQQEFAIGLKRVEWQGNTFTSRILLSEKEARNLMRTLQSFLDKLRAYGEKNVNKEKEKKEN